MLIIVCVRLQLYAEKQFPGNPEQQAVLIHQLQREHYHQYMQQLHLQSQGQAHAANPNQNLEQQQTLDKDNDVLLLAEAEQQAQQQQQMNNNNSNSCGHNTGSANLAQAMDGLQLNDIESQSQTGEQPAQSEQLAGDEYDDYVMIRPAKIWTRPDIEQFKTEVSAGDGDGVITIGHGDTVTVRILID